MKLYSYFRSSAAYRVRIALALKGIASDYIAVNLLHKSNLDEQYLSVNPQGLLPALSLDNSEVLAQSIAILEWLEETQPQAPLLPVDALQRARVRAMVNSVSCDVHPLCNISIVNYLRKNHRLDDADIHAWMSQWMHRGFGPIEKVLQENGSRYSFSDHPCMADIVLVPQVYNARRFNIDLSHFPSLLQVVDQCEQLPAFIAAHPDNQTDSPSK